MFFDKKLLAMSVVLLSAVSLPHTSHAYLCWHDKSNNDIKQDANHIFTGKVVQIEDIGADFNELKTNRTKIGFEILQIWKGLEEEQTFAEADVEDIYEYNFETGQEYLVYGYDLYEGRISLIGCPRIETTELSKDFIKTLGTPIYDALAEVPADAQALIISDDEITDEILLGIGIEATESNLDIEKILDVPEIEVMDKAESMVGAEQNNIEVETQDIPPKTADIAAKIPDSPVAQPQPESDNSSEGLGAIEFETIEENAPENVEFEEEIEIEATPIIEEKVKQMEVISAEDSVEVLKHEMLEKQQSEVHDINNVEAETSGGIAALKQKIINKTQEILQNNTPPQARSEDKIEAFLNEKIEQLENESRDQVQKNIDGQKPQIHDPISSVDLPAQKTDPAQDVSNSDIEKVMF